MRKKEQSLTSDPQIKGAVEELRALIAARYPSARFDVFEHDDPQGVHLLATVDLEDTDEVIETVLDALYGIQVDRCLPVYVVTEQPAERIAEQLRELGRRTKPVSLPPLS